MGIGLGLSAIVFAWNAAKQLEVTAYTTKDDNGKPLKIYEVAGQLFFAATHRFPDYFSPEDDPVHVRAPSLRAWPRQSLMPHQLSRPSPTCAHHAPSLRWSSPSATAAISLITR